MKEGRLLGNGICGMLSFWMHCSLPNSTETQIKTVICQLKQDFTQSQSGLYASGWHGPNSNTANNQNHETTNLTIEEETTGFLQSIFNSQTTSWERTLKSISCLNKSGQFDREEITILHIFSISKRSYCACCI